MNKLRQSLRRKKPAYVPEAARPHQWQADEEAVRRGRCSFPVRYLGHAEVDESRGMHVCEEAVKKLKASGRKAVKSVLWVSADGLRVVDDKTKDLLVDQTIEKVSFCAPDRNFDKAFSYICRDGTTRRWICHCFLALKDSGERLSHAVGCAFAACLERKQRREKECGLSAAFDASRGPDRRRDETPAAEPAAGRTSPDVAASSSASSAVTSSVVTSSSAVMTSSAVTSSPLAGGGAQRAIPRRHAPLEQLVRQGSFRGFPSLGRQNSPFKRQLSLRLDQLPSTLQRRHAPEAASSPPGAGAGVTELGAQTDGSFACPPPPALDPDPPQAEGGIAGPASWVEGGAPGPPRHRRTPSEAERWLEEVSKAALAQQQQGAGGGSSGVPPAPFYEGPPPPAAPGGYFLPPHLAGGLYPPSVPVVGITPSQMVANIFCAAGPPLHPPPLPKTAPPGLSPPPAMGPPEPPPDPFEVQWAALGAKPPPAAPPPPPQPPNPFAGDLQKTFEIEL